MRASATREKLNILVCLTLKRSSVLTYRNFVLKKIVLFQCFLLDLIGNGFAILLRMAMESWTLVLFMAGPKSVLEVVHISRVEIAEKNNHPRVLERSVCLFGDTFTCVSNCYRK